MIQVQGRNFVQCQISDIADQMLLAILLGFLSFIETAINSLSQMYLDNYRAN